MRLNKKGITLVEMIVSLALISTVLIFLVNLFVNVRETYLTSKINADFDMSVSTFTKAIGEDIENYGLLSVEVMEGATNGSAVIFTFDDYRPTRLSERIQKVLKVIPIDGTNYQMSYTYDSSITKHIVSAERITNVVRSLPEGCFIDSQEHIHIRYLGDKAVEVSVPLMNKNGTNYSINVYGLLREDKSE